VPRRLRICVELRNPTWLQDSTFRLLEEHGAAYCVMRGAGLPCVLRATAPFVYVRLHGPDHHHLYAGSYSQDDLRWWAGTRIIHRHWVHARLDFADRAGCPLPLSQSRRR
jgi:uncharacterized protein YecE (DUF72 family)